MSPAAKAALHICRSGRHCVFLTGLTKDGRCLACRRESHRSAQERYEGTAAGMLTKTRHNSTRRGNR